MSYGGKERFIRHMREEYAKREGKEPSGKDAREIEKAAQQIAEGKNPQRVWDQRGRVDPLVAVLVTVLILAVSVLAYAEQRTSASSMSVVLSSDHGGVSITDGTVRLAGAVALADNMANPTAPTVGAHLLGWDGSTWDRIPGSAESGLEVQGAVADGSAAGGNPVQMGGVDGNGNAQALLVGTDGSALVGFASPATLADNLAIAVAPTVAAVLMGFDGTNYDRVTNGGGAEAAALRVTLANDSTGLVSVDDNAGSLTVDNAALSVTGGGAEATAMRVTLANDSTGLVSVDDNGANLSVDWGGTVPPIGAGTEAGALRVTVATDSTGVVSVDDNASSLTIDHAILGAQADAAVTTDTNAALNQHVRGLIVLQKAASTDINTAVTADVDAAVAASAGLRLKGFSCRESAGTAAAATFQIVNGATGAAAGKVFVVELTANESRSEWFGPEGLDCADGISIDWIAGTVDVYLHYVDVE